MTRRSERRYVRFDPSNAIIVDRQIGIREVAEVLEHAKYDDWIEGFGQPMCDADLHWWHTIGRFLRESLFRVRVPSGAGTSIGANHVEERIGDRREDVNAYLVRILEDFHDGELTTMEATQAIRELLLRKPTANLTNANPTKAKG